MAGAEGRERSGEGTKSQSRQRPKSVSECCDVAM
jgi:hypothetical protein